MNKYNKPNTLGRFGEYGGMYVSETLMPLLLDLDTSYQKSKKIKNFKKNYLTYLKIMSGAHPHFIMLKIYHHILMVQSLL